MGGTHQLYIIKTIMKTVIFKAALILLALAFTNCKEGPNLFVNGDFSRNPLTPGLNKTMAQQIPGWELSEPIEMARSRVYNPLYVDYPVVLLTKGTIKQTVNVQSDGQYNLRVDFDCNSPECQQKRLKIVWDEQSYADLKGSKQYRVIKSVEFVVRLKKGHHTFRFEAFSQKEDFGGMILTNIKLFTTIPEPDDSQNLLVNGDFSQNPLKGTEEKMTAQQLPGWEISTSLQITKGKYYSPNWKDTPYVLLNTQNDFLKQNVNIVCPGTFLLTINYACKNYICNQDSNVQEACENDMCTKSEENVVGSIFQLYLDGRLSGSFDSQDQNQKTRTHKIYLSQGIHYLKFAGYGTQTKNGRMGISGIELKKFVDYGHNYIVNGDFSLNSLQAGENYILTKQIPGWEVAGSGPIFLGKGSTLNSAQGDRTVVQLDFDEEILRQTIDLGCNKDVVLSFHCAAKTNYPFDAHASVLWNGQSISNIFCFYQQIKSKKHVLFGKDGNNTLEFRGQGLKNNQGLAISNIQLYLRKPSETNYRHFLRFLRAFDHQ